MANGMTATGQTAEAAVPRPPAPLRAAAPGPRQFDLTLVPSRRFDIIDVTGRLRREHGDALAPFRRVAYCSLHTTAGFLEQSLLARLEHRRDRLDPFMRAFLKLFPAGGPYRHDQMENRCELSDEQRRVEPPNADSHLAFIGSGLRNCVTYRHRPGEPVYFLELDGIHEQVTRTRRTRILAFNREEVAASAALDVPVSRHTVDSINLADPRLGVLELAEDLIGRHGVERGRIDLTLEAAERDAGITVNEYETLLMRHDLMEVLRDPFRHLTARGRSLLRDPASIPIKSLDYAKYDAVHLLNEIMDALKLSETSLARLLTRIVAVPAQRFLRLKRHVSLLVSEPAGGGTPGLVRGTYQSPILVQWAAVPRRARTLRITLTRFR